MVCVSCKKADSFRTIGFLYKYNILRKHDISHIKKRYHSLNYVISPYPTTHL